MTSTTFVTSFYDLATIENNTRRRTAEKYYELAEEILKRPIDLVFIGEEKDTIRVWRLRRDAGFADRTFCLTIPFQSLPTYEHIPALQKIITEKGVYGIKDDARLTAHYVALTWCKLFFLHRASLGNPFDSSHFCWVDFGYFHMREQYDYLMPGKVLNSVFENINSSWQLSEENQNPRFRICLLKDFKEDEIIDAKEYYARDNFQMAATVMGGRVSSIEKVWEKFKKQMSLVLRLGIASPEENIIGRIAFFFPELFDFTLGYYSTSLQNFGEITMCTDDFHGLGIKYRKEEKKQEAFDILSKIAEAILSGQAVYSGSADIKNIVYQIFYELIICSFYVNYTSYCRYRDFFREWLNENNYPIEGLLKMNLSF